MSGKLGAAGWVLLVLGIGCLINGVWMLLDTERWFGEVAAATGALNLHFVRDVAFAYLSVGAALSWAALRPALRLPLTAVAAAFLGLHALGHVYETAVGQLPPGHWLEDLPGVYLPALVTLGLSAAFARREPGAA